jgi:hypothetical protein
LNGIFLLVKNLSEKLPATVQESRFPDNVDATYQDLAEKSLHEYGEVIQKQNKETGDIWNMIEIDFPSYDDGEMGSFKYLADRKELFLLKKEEIRKYFQQTVVESVNDVDAVSEK